MEHITKTFSHYSNLANCLICEIALGLMAGPYLFHIRLYFTCYQGQAMTLRDLCFLTNNGFIIKDLIKTEGM